MPEKERSENDILIRVLFEYYYCVLPGYSITIICQIVKLIIIYFGQSKNLW